MKSTHMRATNGKYDVSMYSISFHSDLSRIFRSAGFIKNIFCCFYALSWVMSISTRAKRYHSYVFQLEPFVWYQIPFDQIPLQSELFGWMQGNESWLQFVKSDMSFSKFCNSWNFLLLKVPQNFADIFQIRTTTFSCRKVMGIVSDFAKFSRRYFYLNSYADG